MTEHATPERIAKGDSYVSDTGIRTFKDDPLERLAAKGALWPDIDMNQRLLEAGQRYYSDYFLSNMDPLASFDPTRIFSGGNGASCGMPASERQAVCRSAYRAARTAVGKFYLEVLDLVALQMQGDLVAIGRKVGGVQHERAARAIAMERLRAGLYLLAKHYG